MHVIAFQSIHTSTLMGFPHKLPGLIPSYWQNSFWESLLLWWMSVLCISISFKYSSLSLSPSPLSTSILSLLSPYTSFSIVHFPFLTHRCRSGAHWMSSAMAREMATNSHTLIPELTLIAVIAKKPVVMVATRWFCVSTSIHTCLQSLAPADKSSQIWSASRLLDTGWASTGRDLATRTGVVEGFGLHLTLKKLGDCFCSWQDGCLFCIAWLLHWSFCVPTQPCLCVNQLVLASKNISQRMSLHLLTS